MDIASKLRGLQLPPNWLMAAIGAALIVGIGIAWLGRDKPAKVAASVPIAVASPAPISAAPVPSTPTKQLPYAPGAVATVAELAKPWSEQHFIYRDSLTEKEIPAMVVHLPGGTYWGFSLREPYGTCDLEYVTDLQKLDAEYHYRANHPMVGDPCNRTVFDLEKYASNPDGRLVRGAIAQGAGIRPPMAIEIRTRGTQVIALKME